MHELTMIETPVVGGGFFLLHLKYTHLWTPE